MSSARDFSDVADAGIRRRRVDLEYPKDVFQDTALTVRADPDVVRILFSEV